MIRASEYAAKVKRLLNRLRREHGKPAAVEPTDPLEQMLTAILARNTTDAGAREAYAQLREATVDLNDLRVTRAADICEIIGNTSLESVARARAIRDALKEVFDRENNLSLDFLRDRGRREARQYLESMRGVSPFVAASVMLFSLGGHAVPLDDAMLDVLRAEKVVHPGADLAVVQAFLERHVSAADALAFTCLVRAVAATRPRPKVKPPAEPPKKAKRTTATEKPEAKASEPAKKKAKRATAKKATRAGAAKSAKTKTKAKAARRTRPTRTSARPKSRASRKSS